MLQIHCEAPDSPVRSLDEHSFALGEILYSREAGETEFDFPEWNHAGDLLHLASGVLRVEINPYLFDVTSLYCGSAGDYQDAKSKVVSDYQTETTRFLFTWSAFETIVGALRPQGWKDGKTRAAGRLLASRFEPEKLLHYDCAMLGLRKLAITDISQFSLKDTDFAPSGSYSKSGVGIKLVSQVRNRIVHGAVEFPEPSDWGGPAKEGIFFARLSRRLVLYTIQMMLVTNYTGSGLKLERYNYELDVDTQIEIDGLLKTIHLERVNAVC